MSKGIAEEAQGFDVANAAQSQKPNKLQSFYEGYLHRAFQKTLIGSGMTSLFVVPIAGGLATNNNTHAVLNSVQPSLISGIVFGLSAVLCVVSNSQEPSSFVTHQPMKNFGKRASLLFPIAVTMGVGALAINLALNEQAKTEVTTAASVSQEALSARTHLQQTASVTYTMTSVPMMK